MPKQIDRSTLRADHDVLAALKAMPDYKPANDAYTVEKVQAAADALLAAQDERVQARGAARAARDNAVDVEWDFHDFILAVKEQVRAQYGISSDQVQSVGLKKKCKRAKPSKKDSPTPAVEPVVK